MEKVNKSSGKKIGLKYFVVPKFSIPDLDRQNSEQQQQPSRRP
jgi:hypothetical protein